jgi:hypothetical protein
MGADAVKSVLLTGAQPPSLKACGQKPLTSNLRHPYGYNSHRGRLGRDNRPKLFRKTNISNDVAGALHPIGGRFGPDTIELFTFMTLSAWGSVPSPPGDWKPPSRVRVL